MGSIAPPQPSPQNPPRSDHVFLSFRLHQEGPKPNLFNRIDCYSPNDNSWTHVSIIPGLDDNHALKGFAMVALGDFLFVIGGKEYYREQAYELQDPDEFVDVDVDVRILCAVWRYNVRSKQWSRGAPLGTPRSDFACSVCDNKIYVAGGQSNVTSPMGVSTAEVYDPLLDIWTPLPSMTIRRYKCAGVTLNGKFHVVGGFTGHGEENPSPYVLERSSAEVYDVHTGRWELLRRMWPLDVPPNQIVAVGGRLFSCGNCLNAINGHIEAYDGRLWNEVEGSQENLHSGILMGNADNEDEQANHRLYVTMAPVGTRLYILAGYRMGNSAAKSTFMAHVFDTSATHNAWMTTEPFEEEGEKELCSHPCVVNL